MLLPSASSFGPSAVRRRAASGTESPTADDPNCASTSAAARVCHASRLVCGVMAAWAARCTIVTRPPRPAAPAAMLWTSQSVRANRATTAARPVHDRQARRSLLVEFPARFFDRLIHATTRGRRAHDLGDAHIAGMAVASRHPATHIALGDDAHEPEVIPAFDYRSATTLGSAHRPCGVGRRFRGGTA